MCGYTAASSLRVTWYFQGGRYSWNSVGIVRLLSSAVRMQNNYLLL